MYGLYGLKRCTEKSEHGPHPTTGGTKQQPRTRDKNMVPHNQCTNVKRDPCVWTPDCDQYYGTVLQLALEPCACY